MTTTTNVPQVKVNLVTQNQYDTMTKNANEFYVVTDKDYIDELTSSDVITALGYTPENSANLVTSVSASSTDSQYPSAKCLYDETKNLQNLIPITYADLVTLKTNSQLLEGAYYRITDYVTTTVSNGLITAKSETARSAGHAFDIIIQALSPSTLAEVGTASLHAGDTYFATSNLGAWQIWYDINNDTTKYKWADTTNGKGVIYRMIDEWGNDLPYDFKNMQFSRNSSHADFTAVSSYLTVSDTYYYTFTYIDSGSAVDYSIEGKSNCVSNVFGACYDASTLKRVLNNNVCVAPSSSVLCRSNTLDNDNSENTIVGNFYGNRFLQLFYNNTLWNFTNNNGGTYFNNNVMTSAVINTWANQNTFGAYFQNARFAAGFQRNTIGNFCNYLTAGVNFKYNIIGNSNAYITIGDDISTVIIDSSCGYVTVTISNCIIHSKVRGTSGTYFTTSGLPTTATYPITIQADSNGYIIAYWYNQSQLLGQYKSTATASTWSAMSGTQTVGNLVTSVSASSTDSQYPSAKCVYDLVGDIETLLSQV